MSVQTPASTTEDINNEGCLNNANDPPNAQEVTTLHDLTGTIIKLQVNNVGFRIPEPRISKFASLSKLIEDARRTSPRSNTLAIAVHGDNELASDFLNTLELLNTPSFVEPIHFSSKVLVSAARVSAAYDYPALHAFCVKKLEGSSLGSIERLRIGRVLNLKSWEERACRELSERDTMITREEMLALGVDAYFQVASAREKRQREQVDRLSSNSGHCMNSDLEDDKVKFGD
ncbi:hypothetical protein RSOLAG22IIIB_01291 [Rhizoctonia solani]|uniref:BTB domain-containing protein n=1 Tax=Rhizoctonia solani TaxID=456999 RepID=A0A0K6G5Y1_9AGAM|nr:hypothetical protein RSOLAG22IIIB_01291 [Rhizoctonia solani]